MKLKMWNRARILTLFAVFILSVALLMGGCGSGETPQGGDAVAKPVGGESSGEQTGGDWPAVKSGVPVNAIWSGSISTEYKEDENIKDHMGEFQGKDHPENLSTSGYYLVIDGLADQEVEDAINQKIYDMYMELCSRTELPAYRGIKQIQRSTTLSDVSVYSMWMECVGNLYSVSCGKYWSFAGEDVWYYVTATECAVFDLKTGEEVPLSAMFGDDVDYIETVNQAVLEKLPPVTDEVMNYYEHNGDYIYNDDVLQLVGPYRGIDEDQKFLVTSQGIIIFFDEEDDEFDTNFGNSASVTLNYSDIDDTAVYPVRFKAEQDVFEAPVTAALVPDNTTEYTMENSEENGFSRQVSLYWPSRLSQEDLETMTGDDLRFLNETADQWYIQNEAVIKNEGWGYLSQYSTVNRFGPYYSVEHALYGGCTDDNIEYSIRRVFYGPQLQELSVEDLFVQGFDLKGCLWDELNQIMEEREQETPGSITRTAEEAWEHRSANFSAEGIIFNFPVSDNGGYVGIYRNYSDLGYDNVVMFQQ
ncbi:MAG: hypothetical protein J6E42_10400 [Firmicutes bacterium]|nr:hypothetical protein [Bacillota bacterium]